MNSSLNNNVSNSEVELNEFIEKVKQIEVLIDRISDPSHYRFFNDVDFIVDAIGEMDYPGSPAVDVLPSHDDIEIERRDMIKDYLFCLSMWSEGTSLEDALGEFKVNEKILRNIYRLLGALDGDKFDLVQYLIKSLEEKVSSPEDILSQVAEEEFIYHVYKTILGRDPDEDELKLKLMGFKRGKTRQELVREIMESRETNKRMLAEIAASIELEKSNK